jgi:hypothetical protein
MLAQDQFAENDRLDSQRAYSLFLAALNSALGEDAGAGIYDGQLTNPVGQNQILNISTGTATQGRAATVNATVAGHTLSVPMVLIVGAGLWLLLRRK